MKSIFTILMIVVFTFKFTTKLNAQKLSRKRIQITSLKNAKILGTDSKGNVFDNSSIFNDGNYLIKGDNLLNDTPLLLKSNKKGEFDFKNLSMKGKNITISGLKQNFNSKNVNFNSYPKKNGIEKPISELLDNHFITKKHLSNHYTKVEVDSKVKNYTAGDNITIDRNNVISASKSDLSNHYTKREVDSKVKNYTAGDNIIIDRNNVISASKSDLSNHYTKREVDSKVKNYTAGDNITIDSNNVISTNNDVILITNLNNKTSDLINGVKQNSKFVIIDNLTETDEIWINIDSNNFESSYFLLGDGVVWFIPSGSIGWADGIIGRKASDTPNQIVKIVVINNKAYIKGI